MRIKKCVHSVFCLKALRKETTWESPMSCYFFLTFINDSSFDCMVTYCQVDAVRPSERTWKEVDVVYLWCCQSIAWRNRGKLQNTSVRVCDLGLRIGKPVTSMIMKQEC
jgi:hypothetical protein